MKSSIKSVLSLFLVLVMLFSLCHINTFAASTVISFNKKSLTVGETVNVTVTFNADEKMYGVSGVVNYDSNVLEYKSGVAVGSAGTLKIVESPSGLAKTSYTLTFTAKKAGSCAVSVADCFYSGQTEDKGLSGASATVNVTDKSLSANANLKSLYLSSGTLTPAFSPDITTYEVIVKNSVTECKFSAKTADADAKIDVEGSATLKIGKNTRTIVVTAPSGATKKYTVNITRNETDEEIPVEENPLEVEVEGKKMVIAADISSVKLFNGFTASVADFGEEKVAVASDADKNYTVYYLKPLDEDTLIPYTYDEENDTFEKLKYFTQGELTYIFDDIPEEKAVPDSLYLTNVQIMGTNVKCYAQNDADMRDFYYIYCFSGDKYGFYRFDSRENTIQRYPEIELIESIEEVEKEKVSFKDRFNTLTTNAKIVVVGIGFVILAVIVLIIMAVLRLIERRNYEYYDDGMVSDEDFDSITIESFATPDNTVSDEDTDN